MMPPEQESSIAAGNVSPNIMLTNWTETVSVHAEPSVSSINTTPCSQDRLPDKQEPNPPRFQFYFEDVAYSINLSTKGTCSNGTKSTKIVLNGVSGIIRPGELLAMLGPSGSGKTTLLTALAGRLPGKVSVIETLTYAALLRLPKKLNREEKIEQAEMVIKELGLTRCRNNIVGGPLLRGVSGGERKRVSIGQEMLVNPSLLLLDEPTSGLDSTTAQRIVATIKGLARGGRTVITTIHQPSSRLYRMFDKVVVLSDGCPIYCGQAGRVMEYFGSIGYEPGFSFMNPADFLLDLANVDHLDDQNSTKQSLISSYKKNLYPALKAEIRRNFQDQVLSSSSGALSLRNSEDQWTTTWWQQFRVVLRRGLQERKHESFSGLRIFQVMSVSILSGLLWWHSGTSHIQDQVGLLFFFSIFWGFFPLFNAIFTFPQERPMLIKERSSGMYRLSSYYFARIAGDLPMELVLPTIFVTVTYWMGGLRPP
ncbi:hypothetical protein GH714_040059 [Hevea brasiliensis]|uniref:ABC transporter domain-containing protein n=1 Tax=Hevea brasiliensis TaxID=3981 RepID=A0A6A6MG90_HEVBR|nr:hypothetical protein GH714_040059 [Hevea brasiliensis]